jgi:hypothetical protein
MTAPWCGTAEEAEATSNAQHVQLCDGCGGLVVRVGSISQLKLIDALKLCRVCVSSGDWQEGAP